mmetsp:Transcript_1887/g.5360  ORF Transcript_1887/g.5360 Transcript_1887/m.5360 type:complete len:247 (-) Transcript_1887:343-1083(-)
MAFLAVARALSSSPRLFVSASKSWALSRQLAFRSPLTSRSSASSFEVTSRSPSAFAFAWPLWAMPFLASERSEFPNLISSVRLCFSVSKLFLELVSSFRSESSWDLALSRRSPRTSMMPPLWPWYTSASGAPRSSSSSPCPACWEPCTSAASFFSSAVLSREAWTIARRAPTTPPSPAIWSMEAPAPLAISFSRMPIARSRVPTTSESSASSAAKSLCSFARISVAAFRSASSRASSAASSSILVS